jgi:Ca-activated chloride channel family protein
MFSFQHTEYLLGLIALIPLCLVFFAVVRWKKKVTKLLGDEKLIYQLTKKYSAKRFTAKFVVLLVALALIIIAAANLRKQEITSRQKTVGIDVVIALDVSKSMWAEDVKPSRLDAAKQFINTLITRLDGNRVALVLFAGQAFLQMPLTSDISVARLYVSNASTDAVPVQGTVVGEALTLCQNSLDIKEKKSKAVVLISDGEDHDPKSTEVLQQLSDNGVTVYTVGVGSVQGAPIMEPGASTYKVDMNGQTVVSKLNETELMQIAQQTGGVYYHLDDVQAVSNSITSVLNSMEKKAIENNGGAKQYASFYYVFALIALLILIAEIFIPEVSRKNATNKNT